MLKRKGFKYRIRSNGRSREFCARAAGCRRWTYNKGLEIQLALRAEGKPMLSTSALMALLPVWKRESKSKFLKKAPAQVLQQGLWDLAEAFKNMFEGRAKLPTFKKKGQSDSFRFPQPEQIELDEKNSRIFLPKFGEIEYIKSRDIKGEIANVTVSLRADEWYLSIQTEWEEDVPPPTGGKVGVDLGTDVFAALSDGTLIKPINSFKKHEKRLAKAMREMSRKTPYSKNWKKAKKKVQQIQAQIADVRRDFLHKLSTLISKNHAMVGVEDLKVKNMTASASGTVDNPGKKVAQKSGLNRAILDQGWGMFREMLDYKLTFRGGHLIRVNPAYTSQTCPVSAGGCGHVSAGNRPKRDKFCCEKCGYKNHADVVGAINVLERAELLLAAA